MTPRFANRWIGASGAQLVGSGEAFAHSLFDNDTSRDLLYADDLARILIRFSNGKVRNTGFQLGHTMDGDERNWLSAVPDETVPSFVELTRNRNAGPKVQRRFRWETGRFVAVEHLSDAFETSYRSALADIEMVTGTIRHLYGRLWECGSGTQISASCTAVFESVIKVVTDHHMSLSREVLRENLAWRVCSVAKP